MNDYSYLCKCGILPQHGSCAMYRRSFLLTPVFLSVLFWIAGSLWGSFLATVSPLPSIVPLYSSPSAFGLFCSAFFPLLFVCIFRALHWDGLVYGLLFVFSFVHSFSLFYLCIYSFGLLLSQCCCGFFMLLVCFIQPPPPARSTSRFYISTAASAVIICLLDFFFIP